MYNSNMLRPFLKWAGNKYRILDKIIPLLKGKKRLIEPFVGSGAVFLNTDYESYILNDKNSDLINLYRILSEKGIEFIEFCESFFTKENNKAEKYYEFRELFNSTSDVYLRSALFIYLNRHGYNGLCRYNKKGKFNTPFGRYKKPYFPKKEMIAFFEKLRSSEIKFFNDDFEPIMKMATKDDAIYCDPPYVPLSGTAYFTDYSKDGFTIDDQKRLSKAAIDIANKGALVVISNHETTFTINEYKDASKIIKFNVRRYISCDGENRNNAPEILAVFGKCQTGEIYSEMPSLSI